MPRKKRKNRRQKLTRPGLQPGSVPARVRPTPQTAARLTADPLWTLLKRGVLSDYQIEAALAIRTAFRAITLPLQLKRSALEKIDGGRSPSEDTPRMIELYKRYNDWIDEMSRYRWPVGPILDVVVEGHACREIDRRRRYRHGKTQELLADGLDLYCRVAGWPETTSSLAPINEQ